MDKPVPQIDGPRAERSPLTVAEAEILQTRVRIDIRSTDNSWGATQCAAVGQRIDEAARNAEVAIFLHGGAAPASASEPYPGVNTEQYASFASYMMAHALQGTLPWPHDIGSSNPIVFGDLYARGLGLRVLSVGADSEFTNQWRNALIRYQENLFSTDLPFAEIADMYGEASVESANELTTFQAIAIREALLSLALDSVALRPTRVICFVNQNLGVVVDKLIKLGLIADDAFKRSLVKINEDPGEMHARNVRLMFSEIITAHLNQSQLPVTQVRINESTILHVEVEVLAEIFERHRARVRGGRELSHSAAIACNELGDVLS